MSESGEILVRLRDVDVRRDGFPVLEGVTLDVREGDVLGIIGPNGGGKTTLLKVILGLIRPDKGTVEVLGGSPFEARRDVGYVPQSTACPRGFPLTVEDVVLMGRLGRRGILRPFTSEDRRYAREALAQVEMEGYARRPIGALSGGECQRVFIARALAGCPRLLLLDEPTASVDPVFRVDLYGLLRRIRPRTTIVLVTHDMGAVSTMVGKIACLNVRLFYHGTGEIPPAELERVYHCPVDVIAHGVPHRVLKEH